jgi:hypothetical protein
MTEPMPCRRRALNQWRQSQSVIDAHEHMAKSYVMTTTDIDGGLIEKTLVLPEGFSLCVKCNNMFKTKGLGSHKRFCK